MEVQKKFNEDDTVTLTFPSGTELTVQRIAVLAIQAIQSSKSGKPQIPWVEVTKARGRKTKERNPDDPDYVDALKNWQIERNGVVTQYIITRGVVDDPPERFADEVRDYVDMENEDEVKFMWVGEMLLDANEIEALADNITEFSAPTSEGISDSEDNFRGNGEQQASAEVSVQTQE